MTEGSSYPLSCDTRFDDTEVVFPGPKVPTGGVEELNTAPLDLNGIEIMNEEEVMWEKWKGVEMGESAHSDIAGSASSPDGAGPVVTIKDHMNDVTCVSFSGRSSLATGSCDKKVRLYKWQRGDNFRELPHSPLLGHTYAINSIAFSPYGTKLSSASTDGYTFIWDVKTGSRICSLRSPSDHPASVRVCTFSPNSSFLATAGDEALVSVWDVSTLSLLRSVGGHEESITTVSFSPDSSYLASGCSGGEIKLWDARYGHSLPLCTRQEAHDLGVSALHFSPTVGKDNGAFELSKQYLLASGGQDTNLHIWCVQIKNISASISLHSTLSGHSAPLMAVKFSPNGCLLASASGDKTTRLWDAVLLCPISVLEAHSRYVTSCAFSDDSCLLVTGSGDRSVCVWSVESIVARARKKPSASYTNKQTNKFPYQQQFRQNKSLTEWTVDDVCSWLTEMGLAEYSHTFRSEAIDGRELLALDGEMMGKLGIEAIGHRNKVERLVTKHRVVSEDKSGPPSEYMCPITQELIVDPVICADGFTYERVAMEAWLGSNKKTSPMTNETLAHTTLTPNRTLRTLIQKYREDNT